MRADRGAPVAGQSVTPRRRRQLSLRSGEGLINTKPCLSSSWQRVLWAGSPLQERMQDRRAPVSAGSPDEGEGAGHDQPPWPRSPGGHQPWPLSPGGHQQGQVSRAERLGRLQERRGGSGSRACRPTPACLRRAAPGPRTVHGCLCKYLVLVVSLILLGSFLQERLEEQLMYSLLVVSSRGELGPHAGPSVGSLPSYADALTSPCTL